MSAVRMGKYHAVFPSDFAIERYFRPFFEAATLSRRVRAFFYGLPRSRFRTFFVARYYHLLAAQFSDGDFRFLPTLTDDVQLQVALFDFGTFTGRDGAREAMTEWRDTFASPLFKLVELVNPPGHEVCLSIRFGGRGATSGVAVEDWAYFVITAEHGMVPRILIHRDKAAALAAVGLEDRDRSRATGVTPVDA